MASRGLFFVCHPGLDPASRVFAFPSFVRRKTPDFQKWSGSPIRSGTSVGNDRRGTAYKVADVIFLRNARRSSTMPNVSRAQ